MNVTCARGVIVVVAILLVRTLDASAHALLIASTPSAETAVAPPPRLTMRFNSRIEPRLSSAVLIRDSRHVGHLILLKAEPSPQADTLVYTVPPVDPGRYRVEWRAMSVDGHITEGVLRFRVLSAPSSPTR